jgi:Domain of unknown function (DUF222)
MTDLDLTTCAPGPRLARLLERTDVSGLDAEQVLAYLAAVRRQQAWTDAQLVRAVARFAEARDGRESSGPPEERIAFGGDGSPLCGSHTPDELRPDLRLGRDAARRLLADSLDLMHRLTAVWLALRIGLVDSGRARMVAEATRELSAETTTAVEQEILGRLHHLTPGQLQRTIDRIAPRIERGVKPSIEHGVEADPESRRPGPTPPETARFGATAPPTWGRTGFWFGRSSPSWSTASSP